MSTKAQGYVDVMVGILWSGIAGLESHTHYDTTVIGITYGVAAFLIILGMAKWIFGDNE